MKRLSLFATLFLAMTAAANAQVEGMGWDGNSSEVVGRLGMGGYSHLEIGVGFRYDSSMPDDSEAQKDIRSLLTVSGRYLLALHSWEKFTGYLHAGGYFRDDNTNNTLLFVGNNGGRAATLSFVVGYQPEIVLLQHLAVSTLFGLAVPIMPDLKLGLVGEPLSIVEGLNFRILF